MTINGTSAVPERSAPSAPPALSVPARIDWVDYAKGICIVMVVMMHSVLGVEAAAGQTGFMHGLVAFAKPFRMPDFFLISGLFLAVVIDRDWRTYLDRKVVHFAYFYVLWVTIQFGFKAPSFAAESGWSHVGLMYLESFIEPFGTLWFIYLLPVFFVVTKLTHKMPPLLIWGVAALLEMAHIATGWTVIDEFAARFVYFYSGYLFASHVFALSDRARARPALALAGLALWALVNGGLVEFGLQRMAADFAGAWPGRRRRDHRHGHAAGANAVAEFPALLAASIPSSSTSPSSCRWRQPARCCCGQVSIHDIGTISLIVTVAGVLGAIAIWRTRWRCTPISCSNARPRSGSRRRNPAACCSRRSSFPYASTHNHRPRG